MSKENAMLKSLIRLVVVALASSLAAAAVGAQEQQQLVDRAQASLNNFLRDPEMGWLQKNLPRARAVLIAPEIVKAGFVIGGSGGRAVLVARDAASGRWRGPVFYTLATASVGFQAGIAASETVTLVMTEKGLNTLLAPSMKVGADASIAAGPVGAGAAADVTTDFVSFARSKGVYGGLNLDGTLITVNNDWNKAYYGKAVLPPDVLVRGTASNAKADALLSAVAKAPH
jgi:lipid-binding SYLF domain-containing protein